MLECRSSINGKMPATEAATLRTTTIPSNISWKIVWQCIQWKGCQQCMLRLLLLQQQAEAAIPGSNFKIECNKVGFLILLLFVFFFFLAVNEADSRHLPLSWRMINVKWNGWESMLPMWGSVAVKRAWWLQSLWRIFWQNCSHWSQAHFSDCELKLACQTPGFCFKRKPHNPTQNRYQQSWSFPEDKCSSSWFRRKNAFAATVKLKAHTCCNC